MEKQVAGFWEQLEFFLIDDHDARWRAIGWIIFLVGIAGSLDLVVADSSPEDAVRSMAALTVILSIGWIGAYCVFRPYQHEDSQPVSRRSVIRQAVYSAIGFVVAGSLWRFQAQALTSDLLDATKKNDYDAAKHVIDRARVADVRLDKTVVRSVGQRFIKAAAQPAAWDAALNVVAYRSFMNSHLSIVRATQDVVLRRSTLRVPTGELPNMPASMPNAPGVEWNTAIPMDFDSVTSSGQSEAWYAFG